MEMRILVIDSTSTFGGAFELAVILCRYLNKIPDTEAILVSAQPVELLETRLGNSMRYHHLPWNTFSAQSGSWLYRKLCALRSLIFVYIVRGFQLARIARRERVDIIHLNNVLTAQCHGVVAARLLRLPCISVHRGYEHHSPVIKFFERGVTHHIASSEPVKQDLLNLGVSEKKITILADGIDLEKFSPDVPPLSLELEFGIPSRRRVVSIFGRLVPWKGQDQLLVAFTQVLKIVPESHLLIVGDASDGTDDYAASLEEISDGLLISDHVTFTGFRSDVAELMRASDVLVHASTTPEPFGTVIMEGMACSKPYVAMNEGGPAVMIEDGVSGYLIPPRNTELMVEKITHLLQHPGQAKDMGRAARERVEKLFSAEKFAESHLAVYRQFVKC